VRGDEGYVDVASATGDASLSDLEAVLAGDADVLPRVRDAPQTPGVSWPPTSSLRPCLPPGGSSASESTTSSTRSKAVASHHLAGDLRPRRRLGCRPYGELVKPHLSSRFDYEGELAIVIGYGGATSDRRLRRRNGRHRPRMAARGDPMHAG